MEGLRFLRGEHLSVMEGMYLPYAAIPDLIWKRLAELTPKDLLPYTPDLMKCDFLLLYDKETSVYGLFISPESSRHLPTWGSKLNFFKEHHDNGISFIPEDQFCVEVTGQELAYSVFETLDFKAGPAVIGRFPIGYDDEAKAKQMLAAEAAAAVIWSWAEKEKTALENAGIFLSHKGVNKPLVEKIDGALRLVGLKPWLDKHDLPAGEPLVRGLDDAFAHCAAAVFFISDQYQDAGVIAQEISRALHENATRPAGFKIIPLVLAQHGGVDQDVPAPLQKLKWETVDDVDIVPTILRVLPPAIQALIRYAPPR